MNTEEFEAQLADYLGDELAPEARTAFEAHLAQHPDRRAEVDELRATLADLERLQALPRETGASSRMANTSKPARHSIRLFASLGKAAAILIFGILLGRWSAPASHNPAPAPSDSTVIADAAGVHPGWVELANRLDKHGGTFGALLRASANDFH